MDKIPVNVIVSDRERERILAEEATWTGPKLVVLTVVVLALSITALIVASGIRL